MPTEGFPSTFANFVGRKRERAELTAALDETGSGRGRLFLLSGEPGIGKTRLAEEVAREATNRGMRAVWGRCWEGSGAPAYWPWIQLIRALIASLDADQHRQIFESEHSAPMVEAVAQIVPELHTAAHPPRPPGGARSDPAQTQFRLFDSVATFLRNIARFGRMVIFLDDLHDADAPSLAMLRLVARELTTIDTLIVGTYREVEVQRSPDLSRQIGDLGREGRPLALVGLSAAEVAQFYGLVVGEQPGAALTERLFLATGGNPLFVDGVVRALVSDRDLGRDIASQKNFRTPASVREAIRRRLAILSDDTQSVLQIAAVCGAEFETAICLRVGGIAPEQLNSRFDEALSHGIAAPLGQGRFRFAHALIRSSIYETLDTNNRMRLHGAIGAALEEVHADNLADRLDELAHHFREADIREKAIDYSRRAGTAARAVFAYAAAAEHFRAAAALTQGHRDARRAGIMWGLGEVEGFFFDPARGITHLEEALKLYRELNDGWQIANTCGTLGLVMAFLRDFSPETSVARALEYFHQAEQWQGEWPSYSLGWVHRGKSVALFQQLRIDEALASARRAIDVWRENSIYEQATAGAWLAQLLAITGRHRESASLLHQVMQALGEIDDPTAYQVVTWTAAWIPMLMRDPAEARRFYSMGIARRGISSYQQEINYEFLAFTEIMFGNLPRAKELAALHRMNPAFRGLIALYDGDVSGAIELRRTMIEWSHRAGHLWDAVDTSAHLASTLYLSGDPVQALHVAEGAMKQYDPSIYLLELAFRPLVVSLEVELGRPESAAEHLQICRKIIADGEDWRGRGGLVERAEGILAAAERRPFANHFEKAIATFKRYNSPLEEAETLVTWSRALLSEGNRADSDAKFDSALSIYRRCGVSDGYIELVEKRRRSFSHRAIDPAPSGESRSMFRREDDFWTIAHTGKNSRLRNIKGLTYIAYLLGRPGQRIHVIDMVRAIEGDAEGAVNDPDSAMREGLGVRHDLGDAGDTLDAAAREAYRRRRAELRVELDAAQHQNDPGRIEAARHELDLLTDELSSALGRGGRARKNLDHIERARSLVTKHIRGGIDLIRRSDTDLASHLDRSIHTGIHCAYLPSASERIAWQL